MAQSISTASGPITRQNGQSTSAATNVQVSIYCQIEVELCGDGEFHMEMFQAAAEKNSSLKRKRKGK